MTQHSITTQSTIDPLYLKGDFFKQSHGNVDADYKVQQLRKLLQFNGKNVKLKSGRIADAIGYRGLFYVEVGLVFLKIILLLLFKKDIDRYDRNK